MLTRLSVKNFRLLRDVTIDVELGKPIVLIGPNSSGKSSLLQVLDLLSRWASVGLENGFQAFDGGGALTTMNESMLAVQVDVRSQERGRLRYGVEYEDDVLVAELISAYLDGGNGEEVRIMSRGLRESWIWDTVAKSNGDQIFADANLYGLGQQLIFEIVKQRRSYPYVEELRTALSGIEIYDGFLVTPLWSRDAREGQLSPFDSVLVSPSRRIHRRGLNLINALYDLQANHGEQWEELLDAFRAEFPFVQRLEFPADPAGGRIALGWRDKRYPGVRMQGHQMSEGMASYLCLLAAVLSPEPAAAIAFDEPDAHLHPSAMRRIVHLMEKASERTAVFIATHSDRFLDYLSDPAGSLRICEPSKDGVSIRALDRGALDAWREDYSLSELRERGHLDSTNAGGVEP